MTLKQILNKNKLEIISINTFLEIEGKNLFAPAKIFTTEIMRSKIDTAANIIELLSRQRNLIILNAELSNLTLSREDIEQIQTA